MARGVAAVHGGESVALGKRQEELRVAHAEWSGDARSEELVEREAARAFDDAAEDVGVVPVDPGLAGLRDERESAESIHRLADRLVLVRGVPTEPRHRTERRCGVALADETLRAVRDAGRVREQVEDRDRAARRSERASAVGAARHARVRETGDPTGDRIAERDATLLDEHQRSDARQRLGLRCDPEYRVGAHRAVRLAVGAADGAFVHDLPVPQNECDRTGDPRRVDALLERGVESGEPSGVEGGARGGGPRDGASRGR